MPTPDPLLDVPQPIRRAVADLMDAVADSDYAEALVGVTVWRGALPTLDGSPRRDHVDVSITLRPRLKAEAITITVTPGQD